ncbi:phosphatidylinositol glycan anchor biosynthesis class U protein-like [Dysidea avara]|uniref:phosphatidylinositol glycan anchor biosynthesis class U protein-like n=1 Tax=Dysidea avara TaxID=196820 RepID=UPI00332CC3D7
MLTVKELALLGLAVIGRLLLARYGHEELSRRVEVASPLTSWNNVLEGIALLDAGISPYQGDVCHEPPLTLLFFKLLHGLGSSCTILFYCIVDLLVAVAVSETVRLHLKREVGRQNKEKGLFGKGIDKILLQAEDISHLPTYAGLVYLLNPYSIISCAGQSTSVIDNAAVACSLWAGLTGNSILSTLCLSLATYHSLYPVMLLVPLSLLLYQDRGLPGLTGCLIWFTLWSSLLMVSSFIITGSGDFLSAIYGFIFWVPDQTPNIGLFWYIFTEMFEHFRTFFLCIFQINAFLFTLPLSLRYSNHPMLLAYVLTSLMALFKSYPTISDITVPLALLCMWSHLLRYARLTLVAGCMLLVATVLTPLLWHLWIHAGSANANFYFAMSVLYGLAQIILVTDVLHSFLFYQYDLKNGLPRKLDENGQPVTLKLS